MKCIPWWKYVLKGMQVNQIKNDYQTTDFLNKVPPTVHPQDHYILRTVCTNMNSSFSNKQGKNPTFPTNVRKIVFFSLCTKRNLLQRQYNCLYSNTAYTWIMISLLLLKNNKNYFLSCVKIPKVTDSQILTYTYILILKVSGSLK